jgi:hypothetical protein
MAMGHWKLQKPFALLCGKDQDGSVPNGRIPDEATTQQLLLLDLLWKSGQQASLGDSPRWCDSLVALNFSTSHTVAPQNVTGVSTVPAAHQKTTPLILQLQPAIIVFQNGVNTNLGTQ